MLVTNQEQLHELQLWLQTQNEVCIDIETTGLNRFKDTIIGIGFSAIGTAFYLPLSSYSFASNQLVPEIGANNIATEVLRLLEGKRLRTWNGAFDLSRIKLSLGVDLVPWLHIDGMLLAHTVNENRFSYGLKDIAATEFGASIRTEQVDMKDSIKANGGSKVEFYKADLGLMAKYCMQDCLLTDRLIEKFLPQLAADGLEALFFTDEVMPHYREVTIPMEARGLRIDLEVARLAQSEIIEDLRVLEKSILAAVEPYLGLFKAWFMAKDYPPSREGIFAQAYAELMQLQLPRLPSGKLSFTARNIADLPYGHAKEVLLKKANFNPDEISATQSYLWRMDSMPGFNLLSKHHLKKLFFDTLKEKPVSRTPGTKTYPQGQPQIDDEFLDLMGKKYAWAQDLRTFNRLNKIKGTYIDRFLDEAHDDRFYASYKQHGTVTGRLSGDFQQLPRVLEEGQAPAVVVKHVNRIRNFFIADEGRVLIDADYESLEPHVFAHISKDPAVISIFNAGHDFYSTVAIKTEKLNEYSSDKKALNYLGKLDKAKRQSAKAYALGIAYGEEAYKLSFELGISQEQAERLVRGYWEGFPVLRETSEAGKAQILSEGYICSETGRRRRLHEAKEIAEKHGSWILNSLELWKEFHERGGEYDHMKMLRKRLKKSLNAAINFPTQSLSASIVMRAAIAVNRQFKAEGLDALVVANVHDELLVSASVANSAQAAKILQTKMETIYSLSVRLKAEPSTGTRYGEIK